MSNIQSLHGQFFTADICFEPVIGRISVNPQGVAYLCQNDFEGGDMGCREFFGYRYGFYVDDMENLTEAIQNLKILPSTDKYHALFTEILEKRGPTWDEDGSYSVIPKEVMARIYDFLSEIKDFEPKNLGK